jgi:transcriptional regulator with XRE-family HTH domain
MAPDADQLSMRWGLNLQAVREERGLSRSELAELVGLHQSNLSRIENGKQRPSDEMRLLIAEVLDVLVADIFDYDEQAS